MALFMDISWEALRRMESMNPLNNVPIVHPFRISPLPHKDDFARQPLSASWHHLPCVTEGLLDTRPVHPVVSAIRKQRGV